MAVMATEKLSSTMDVIGNDSTSAHAKAMMSVTKYVVGVASMKPNASKYANNLRRRRNETARCQSSRSSGRARVESTPRRIARDIARESRIANRESRFAFINRNAPARDAESARHEPRAPSETLLLVPRQRVPFPELPPDEIRESITAAHHRHRDYSNRIRPPIRARARGEHRRVIQRPLQQLLLPPLSAHGPHRARVLNHPRPYAE